MSFFNRIVELFSTQKQDYKQLIADGATVIDVRTPEEFKQGNAKGSINIPLSDVHPHLLKLKNKSLIFVCRSGARSGRATQMAKDLGIQACNAGPWQRIAQL